MHIKGRGFSLVELIVFIVVLGITAGAILVPLQTALTKSPTDNQVTVATQLAQGRMEEVYGQRLQVGFSTYSDLCAGGSPPAVCTKPAALSGYTIANATISSTVIGSDGNYDVITINVSGTGNATMQMLTAEY